MTNVCRWPKHTKPSLMRWLNVKGEPPNSFRGNKKYEMIYWSIDWFIDWLIDWFIYLFIDWFIDWLIYWLICLLTYLLIYNYRACLSLAVYFQLPDFQLTTFSTVFDCIVLLDFRTGDICSAADRTGRNWGIEAAWCTVAAATRNWQQVLLSESCFLIGLWHDKA